MCANSITCHFTTNESIFQFFVADAAISRQTTKNKSEPDNDKLCLETILTTAVSCTNKLNDCTKQFCLQAIVEFYRMILLGYHTSDSVSS